MRLNLQLFEVTNTLAYNTIIVITSVKRFLVLTVTNYLLLGRDNVTRMTKFKGKIFYPLRPPSLALNDSGFWYQYYTIAKALFFNSLMYFILHSLLSASNQSPSRKTFYFLRSPSIALNDSGFWYQYYTFARALFLIYSCISYCIHYTLLVISLQGENILSFKATFTCAER